MQSLRVNFRKTTCISFPPQVSRVCFASDATNSQGNHASEETDNSYNADEAISYVPDESVELQRDTNDTAREDDHIKQMKDDKAKENTYDMKETTKDTRDVLEAAAKKTKETAKDAWEATKETTRKIKGSVVGSSSINIDDVWEDHTGKLKIKSDDIVNPEVKDPLNHEKKD